MDAIREEIIMDFKSLFDSSAVIANIDLEWGAGLYPQFVFNPTDEKHVGSFLKKIVKIPLSIMIEDIDKYDPCDLPRTPEVVANFWYGFCKRNSELNHIRTTKNGFWKEIENDEPIFFSESPTRIIGYKKSFVFVHDKSIETVDKPIEAVWFMDEFLLPEFESKRLPGETDFWVICKIRDYTSNEPNVNKAANYGATKDVGEASTGIISDPGMPTAKTGGPNHSSADSFYGLVGLTLAFTGQAAFTFFGMSSSPTVNFVGASSVVGFIGSLSSMLLRYSKPDVSRYLGKVSVIAGAAAVVAVYAARSHPEITWTWGLICGIALLIPSVAILFA